MSLQLTNIVKTALAPTPLDHKHLLDLIFCQDIILFLIWIQKWLLLLIMLLLLFLAPEDEYQFRLLLLQVQQPLAQHGEGDQEDDSLDEEDNTTSHPKSWD